MSPHPFQVCPPGQQRGSADLPAAREIAAGNRASTRGIFVPITTDLAAPFDDKPRNNVQRIEQSMRNLDEHTAKVKANIVQVMIQEKQAIMREGKEQERAHPELAQTPAGITLEEFDIVAQSLMAPAVPGKEYNVRDPPRPDFNMRGPPESLRDDYSRRVLTLTEQAVTQVEGYGRHMEEIQEEYRRALRAEIQRRAEKEAERQ